ncbi:MAG: type IV pilus biogenesis/stability protein PilW [Pseudomonadota bacterium]
MSHAFHARRGTWIPLLALGLAACGGMPVEGTPSPETRPVSEINVQARIHTELGAGYFSRGQYAVALQELKKAREADVGYAPAYNVLGLVHGELREDRQAEEFFRKAISLSPGYSEANNNFGLFLCQRDRAKEAMERFEAALANPLYATPEKALANAGLCALRGKELALAEGYLARALKRAPGLVSAQVGMADVNFRQGRWLAARSLLRQAAEQGELGAQALWVGLRVERNMADRESEASYAAQLRRRFPESMQTQWLLTNQFDQPGSFL